MPGVTAMGSNRRATRGGGGGEVAWIAIRPRINAEPLIEERANLSGSHACVV